MSSSLPTLSEKLMKSLDELDARDLDSDLHKRIWADHVIDWLRTENSVRELLAFDGGPAIWAAATPWREIDTAPKDGRKVLVSGPHQDGQRYADICTWHDPKSTQRGAWTITYMHGYGAPTHWAPQPNSPTKTSEVPGNG